MKKINSTYLNRIHSAVFTSLVAGLLLSAAASTGHAQTLPPGVQDVVKLSQAGISEDVILSQIRNNQATYNLTADQIINLKDQGVSQNVIRALLGGGSSAAAATTPVTTTAVTPVPAATTTVTTTVNTTPTPTLDTFNVQLAADGSWVEVPGVGQCWQPTVTLADSDWRPYFDHGHWMYTDAGWSWQSDYSWGNIVFHYGRWSRFHEHWVWVPGYDWAPAWVCWRETDGYCGWAPLPPAAIFRPGLGLYFHGGLAVDVDFGLGVDAFTFVGYDHFWDLNYRPYGLPRERVEFIFHGSRVINGYRVDHGRFVVEGLGHEHIALVTHHEVHEEREVREVRDLRDNRDNRYSRPGGDNSNDHRSRGEGSDHRGW